MGKIDIKFTNRVPSWEKPQGEVENWSLVDDLGNFTTGAKGNGHLKGVLYDNPRFPQRYRLLTDTYVLDIDSEEGFVTTGGSTFTLGKMSEHYEAFLERLYEHKQDVSHSLFILD
jgi:hypothetical protein